MAIQAVQIGTWSPEFEFSVGKERSIAYANATNDENAKHLSGEFAPPVFAVVPIASTPVLASVAEIVPPDVMARVLHGRHDIHIRRPMRPGESVQVRSMPFGIRVKPSGTTLAYKVSTRDSAGEPVNDQYMTLFFRGATDGEEVGEETPPHAMPPELPGSPPAEVVTQHVDDDQSFRYADASGDRMIIHLDADAARAVGLPGIILHGLCTMAFVGRAVIGTVCADDPERLQRLAVTFSRPVLPGQDITTRIWPASNGSAPATYAFQASNPDAELVITDGLAEVGG